MITFWRQYRISVAKYGCKSFSRILARFRTGQTHDNVLCKTTLQICDSFLNEATCFCVAFVLSIRNYFHVRNLK